MDRLARDYPSYNGAVIKSCVISVETPDDVDNAHEIGPVKEVLEWLTADVELDRQYPGFDCLVLEPSFVAGWDGESVTYISSINRLIELKSMRGDGRVSQSLNEWMTATTDAVADAYYLYEIGNLATDGDDALVWRE